MSELIAPSSQREYSLSYNRQINLNIRVESRRSVRGAASDVSIHGDYLDEVLGLLQRERHENMMLRDQLEMSGSGHWSPSQPPDRCAGNGQERLLTMDSKQLRERTREQVEDEAKQMMEVFQLQPEDPLERVHGRLQQVMVRIGSMEDRLPTEGGVMEGTWRERHRRQ
jgi:hypothetical protein